MCGNSVIELGEDCDTRARPEHEGQSVTCVAAGETNACRYTCDREADPVGCPDGWQCGTDGVCRFASGRFQPGALTSAVRGELELGDVDGDGQSEILVNAVDAVFPMFASGDGGFAPGPLIPAPWFKPVADFGDLNGDGLIDAIVGNNTGFLQFHGQTTGELKPFAHPRFAGAGFVPPATARAFPFQTTPRALEPRLPDQHVLVLRAVGNLLRAGVRTQSEFRAEPVAGTAIDLSLGTRSLGDLAGVPARADLDGDGDDEIAVAFRNVTAVELLSPVVVPGSAGPFVQPVEPTVTALNRQTLALPAAADGNGARFEDADGDGVLDLVVGLVGDHVAVALGLGGGAFGPAIQVAAFDQMGTIFPGVSRAFPMGGAIDLGGSAPGWITNVGVFRANGTLVDNTPITWSEVAVGDFNNDGLQDLAAAVGFRVGFDIWLQTENHLFAHARLETSLTPSMLRVGDFDGDGTTDLAFRESTLLNMGPYSVGISYGSPQGLGTPIAIGDWDDIVTFERASVSLRGINRDGVDDLMIHGVLATGAGNESLTLLSGSPQRLMFGPYETRIEQPVALTVAADFMLIGRFDADDITDVGVAGFGSFDNNPANGELLTGLGRGTGDGNLSAPGIPFISTPRIVPDVDGLQIGIGLTFCSTWQAADLDGDGIDEMIALLVPSGRSACTGTQQILIGSPDGTGNLTFSDVPNLPSEIHRLDLADLDGDGRPELLASSMTGVTVLFREPSGTFTPVSVPTELGMPTAIAVLQADDDLAVEIAVIARGAFGSPGGLVVFDVDGRSFVGGRQVATGNFGDVLLAGDADGDRLDDLIVHDQRDATLHVFLAVPHDAITP